MVITADERRSKLGLFNISEAARKLSIPVRKMHWEIRMGRLSAPQIRLGKRAYYAADDLRLLEQQCAQETSHS
jgi:DNA-binding transcriptional MerR regulator